MFKACHHSLLLLCLASIIQSWEGKIVAKIRERKLNSAFVFVALQSFKTM